MSTLKVVLIILLIVFLLLVIIIPLIIWLIRRRRRRNNNNNNGGNNNNNNNNNNSSGSTINYNDIIQLQNQWGGQNLLSTCGGAPNCGTYNVTLRTDTIEPTSQLWQITNEDLNPGPNTPVKYGDNVQLKNQYGDKLNLAACGNTDSSTSCGVNVIVGRTSPDKSSRTWTIVGGTIGNPVKPNDVIQLKNGYNNLLLSSCSYYEAGGNCGVNVSLRTDTSNSDYPSSTSWKIICSSGTCS